MKCDTCDYLWLYQPVKSFSDKEDEPAFYDCSLGHKFVVNGSCSDYKPTDQEVERR